VARAHHGRALAGMVQEHDRAPGIGGDGLHAANHLRHASKGAAMMGAGDQQQASRGSSVLVDNIRWQSYLSG
ncbi:helicase RepA family protein, partial [Aeromonas caviae]|uniref:helicase RepA family protein n=1 Tax=Aeromonas caviae TaxID=648 RepID=UPI001CC6BD2B